MEIITITKTATYFTHKVTIIFSEHTFTYTVSTAHLPDGKCWVQNYSRDYGVGELNLRLSTSDRKKVKKYFETDFIEQIKYNEHISYDE